MNSSRRQFLRNSALVGATAALSQAPLSASLARTVSGAAHSTQEAPAVRQLSTGWEHFQGSIPSMNAWKADLPWIAVTLPHCIDSRNSNDPDVPYYRGVGWYRTHLEVNNPFYNGRTLLHFEGAGQVSTLYVGGTVVGMHSGGYDEFLWDITDAVAAAPNRAKVPISVCCDNSHDDNRMPNDIADFNMHAGLYRPVSLVYVPAVSIAAAHVHVKLPEDKADFSKAMVSVKARLYNPMALIAPLEALVSISPAKGKPIYSGKRTIAPWQEYVEIAGITIDNPALWSPDSPSLYECTVTISGPHGVSTLHERFGVRRTELVEHGPFLLNGQRLMLRGTQRHMDHALYAAAVPDDDTRKEFHLVKEMGANFIRLAHYQQSRLVMDLCDELGIFVWEELIWDRSGIVSEQFKQMGREKLTNMIDQHFNHPSGLFWGLGNEDDLPNQAGGLDKEATRAYMSELNDLAHKLDPIRYTSVRRCDFARDIPDAYSPSMWAGWYGGRYKQYQQNLEREKDRVKHFIHIEWGAESHAGRHAEDPEMIAPGVLNGGSNDPHFTFARDGDYSESYACTVFDWHLKTQETLPWFVGSAQWIFKDFSTPKRPDNPVPRVNQKGLVERDMTKKEGYFVFQSYWAKKPMAHIYGHSWPIRWGNEGEEKMVKVFSNCPSAELFLNGKSLGVKQRDSQDFPAAGLRWMTPFVAGKNHLRVVATRNAVTVGDEIEFLYQTEKWGEPASFRLGEIAREGGKITVQAELLDAKGMICLDARTRVRFALSGSGQLCDNCGTSRGSRVVQLHNGRAEISLDRGAGSAAITVAAEKLPAATLTLA